MHLITGQHDFLNQELEFIKSAIFKIATFCVHSTSTLLAHVMIYGRFTNTTLYSHTHSPPLPPYRPQRTIN